MTSIKPFAYLPGTQSDGVQSRVVSDITDTIFIPVETSGDSEVNVKSRVQMKLYEARVRARDEVLHVLQTHAVTMEDVRRYMQCRPH